MVGRKKNPYLELEKKIGYAFRRRELLEVALTHRSFRFENAGVSEDNQRLEFLGDAVLGFLTAAFLYDKHDTSDEGVLTSLRSQTASGKALARFAREAGLGEAVRLGMGEERSGGRKRASLLADTLEAIIGAAYLDGGMKGCGKIFRKLLVPRLEELSGDVWEHNPKGKLQEYSQKRWKKSPVYKVVDRAGPAHATLFTVSVRLENGLHAEGHGQSKQEAETRAAQGLLRKLPGM